LDNKISAIAATSTIVIEFALAKSEDIIYPYNIIIRHQLA